MYAFPNLYNFYSDWADGLRSKGVEIRLSHQRSVNGVVPRSRSVDGNDNPTANATTETFDELIVYVLADDAKKLREKTATYEGELCSRRCEILRGYHGDSL